MGLIVSHVAFGLSFIFVCTVIGCACALFTVGRETVGKGAFLSGVSSGIMVASAVWSLLLPSIGDGNIENVVAVAVGFAVGSAFFAVIGLGVNGDESSYKRVFLAMTVHNAPEGASVGFAYGAAAVGAITPAAAFSIAFGIGIQNIPEGAAATFPARKFLSRPKAFLLGTASGLVEPIFGLVGFFIAGALNGIMPYLTAFAAAAMIFTVFSELSGDISSKPLIGAIGAGLGFLGMMLLDVLLG